MSDMPDFDNMSQEEIMAWMESLAKRQGADASGFTTAADLEVPEVDPNSVEAASLSEYIPHGWTKERWDAQLAKEAEQKAQREQQQQPTPPPAEPAAQAPPPPPEAQPAPAQAAAAMSDTPDFDNMSQEEIMAWMESLAKRQGADASGFTTAADLEVPEVDPNSAEAQSLSEYIPHGWTKERWDAQLAKEAEQKAQREQQQQPTSPAAQPESRDEDLELPDLPTLPDEEQETEPILPGFDDLVLDDSQDETQLTPLPPAQDDSMDWLSGLAGNQGSDEAMPDLSGLADATDDLLAGLNLGEGDQASDDPMAWLAGLAGEGERSGDAPGWSGLPTKPSEAGQDESAEDDLLSGLDFSEPDDDSDDDGDPMNWLESLAKRQGASDDELATPADADLPDWPEAADVDQDGPGYSPYSFEAPEAPATPPTSETPETDTAAMDLGSPENWLDQLASNAQDQADWADAGDEDDDDEDDVDEDVFREASRTGQLTPEMAESFFLSAFERAAERDDVPDYLDSEEDEASADIVPAEIPDWLKDQMGAPPVDETAEDAQDFAADEAAMADVLDNVEPEQADIPAWLMGDDALEAQDASADLDEDVSAAEEPELPAWLLEDVEEPPIVNDVSDIFADEPPQAPVAETPPDQDQDEPESLISAASMDVDTSDPWVNALTIESEESEKLANWYQQRLQQLSSSEPPGTPTEPVSPPAQLEQAAAELQPANLPASADVPPGEVEAVPEWLETGTMPIVSAAVATESATSDEAFPDWLAEQADDQTEMADEALPDWLREATETPAGESVPDWLADADIAPDQEIPAWLLETMTEEQAAERATSEISEPELAPEPEPVSPAPTPEPRAIEPVSPAPSAPVPINVAATLQTARQQVSGGQLDEALRHYEMIVRANASLGDVVNDLSKLLEDRTNKKNPDLYRVLGDGLMRQGKLQAALDTYRRALNLL